MTLPTTPWNHSTYKQKVVAGCSAQRELAVLQHDKQESALTEEERSKEKLSEVWMGVASVWEVSGVSTCGGEMMLLKWWVQSLICGS